MADYIIIVEHGRGEQGPTGATGGVTSEVLEAKEAAEAARDEAEKWATEAQKNAEDVKTDLEEYVDAKDFLPFKAKIGLNDDECYAPLYGTFDFSYPTLIPTYIIGDNRGREVLLFLATNGRVDDVKQLYRAVKTSTAAGFQYDNFPVRPSHLSSSEYIQNVLGVGNEYIIYQVYDTQSDSAKYYFAKTDGDFSGTAWTYFKDITTIITDNTTVISAMYFDEYDTIAIVSRSGLNVYLSIYAQSDLSVIYPKTVLINVWDITDKSSYPSSLTMSASGAPTAVYNPHEEQLIIYSGHVFSGTGSPSIYGTYFLPFRIPLTFFRDGVGTITFALTPITDYRPYGNGGGTYNGYYGESLSACYDSYNESIYFTRRPGANVYVVIYNIKLDNRPLDYTYYGYSYETAQTIRIPDATPWAKQIWTPNFFSEGQVWFKSSSTKYGDQYVCSEYTGYETLSDGNYLTLKPGTWWLAAQEETESISSQLQYITVTRVSETENRYILYNGTSLREVFHETTFTGNDGKTYKGRRYSQPLSTPIPELPTTYTYYQYGFDIIRNMAYFLVADKTSLNPDKQGYVFLLVWTGTTNSFVEYRDIPDLDAYWLAGLNSYGYVSVTNYSNNFLIDVDGVAFVVPPHYRTVVDGSGRGGNVFKIDLNDSPVMEKQALSTAVSGTATGSYNYRMLNYDVARGYNLTLSTGYNTIACSKSLNASEAAKSREEFFGGDVYQYKLGLAATVGLVVYLQATPLFLGGHYSTVPEQQITLNPSCDNYIYFNSTERDVVNVEVQKSKIGADQAFSRVLVAKITTDSESIIAQETYAIKWEY